MWRVQCKLPSRVLEVLQTGKDPHGPIPGENKNKPSPTASRARSRARDRRRPDPHLSPPTNTLTGDAGSARGGLDAECGTAWVTHEGKVHAWALPSRAGDRSSEGGAVPDAYAEYDVAPRVAGDRSGPLVHVSSADGGATLWVVAAGAASGKVAVARCDGASGAREEMGEARLPRREDNAAAPCVTAMIATPSSRGGVIAVVGCDRGELFLVECVAKGTVTVTANA